jgi:hypothetical protein
MFSSGVWQPHEYGREKKIGVQDTTAAAAARGCEREGQKGMGDLTTSRERSG